MKSPAMNSPVPSRKKQRSASPSQAMPTSAFWLMTSAVMSRAVLLDQRVGLVIRERAVHLEAQPRRLARQPIEQLRRHDAGHAAAGVEHHVERLERLLVDERQDVLDVAVDDVARARSTPGVAGGAGIEPARIISFISLMPALAAQRKGFLADHLAAVVLAGVVRRGDLRAAVEIVGRDRVIHLVGADQAVVDDVPPCLTRAVDERLGQRRGRRRACRASRRSCPGPR